MTCFVFNMFCITSFFRTIKFQSTQKRKLVVEEEIIEEDQPQEKIVKTVDIQISVPEPQKEPNEQPQLPSSSSSTWCMKDSKRPKKTTSLIGIVKPSVKKNTKSLIEFVKPLIGESENSQDDHVNQTEVKVAPSGLSLLGAYSDSENSDE